MASLLDKAFEFISANENTKQDVYSAYWDVKRYSIGFGTISFAGEKISYDEAKKRSISHIQQSIYYLTRAYPKFVALNINQKVAVLDYAYQYGEGGFLNSIFRKKIDAGEVLDYVWAEATTYPARNKKRVDKFNEAPFNIGGVIFFLILLLLIAIKRKLFQWPI